MPFGSGTATDITARTVGAETASRTGQPVIVENKPGAEGQIGAQAAATATPDGYTLFVTKQTTQAMNGHIYKSLAYDPVKSFAPVSVLSLSAQVVMVLNDLPVKTIGELIALAKAQPGKLSPGSGNGSSRGGAELFKIMVKVDLLSMPDKTQPRAISDLLGGRIDVIFSDFIIGLPPVRDGRARGLAATSRERLPGLTEYPTVQESGVSGYDMWAWTAVYVPAGTPRPIVERLNGLIREVVKSESQSCLHAHFVRRAVRGIARGSRGLPGPRDQEVGRDRPNRRDERALAPHIP